MDPGSPSGQPALGVNRNVRCALVNHCEPDEPTHRLPLPACQTHAQRFTSTYHACQSTTARRRTRHSALAGGVVLGGDDVDLPAGELGGQAGVLSLLADRQRQLVGGNDGAGELLGFVQHIDAHRACW